MKPLIMFTAMLMLIKFAVAQTDKDDKDDKDAQPKGPVVVTQIVLDSFHKAYSGITHADWDYGDGFYEVVFKKDSVDITVDYDVSGNWEEIETEINTLELPKSVWDYLAKNYGSFTLTGASKIITKNFDQAYIARIGKQGKSWDATFDVNGKFLKLEEAD